MSYLSLIILTIAIGGAASLYVRHMLNKYSSVQSTFGLTGAEVAQRMLAYHGVMGVQIRRGGRDQDFFDPRTNSVTLSTEVYDRRTITAAAVACHEVGHACQYAQGYAPMKFRSALVPVVNFASNTWMILLLIGLFLNIMGFINLAIVMYAFAVLFQIVTLPVEFNASARGMSYLRSAGFPNNECGAAGGVLRACALTYVAAALTSILQLLWLLGQRSE